MEDGAGAGGKLARVVRQGRADADVVGKGGVCWQLDCHTEVTDALGCQLATRERQEAAAVEIAATNLRWHSSGNKAG